jgi:hypothetical protein
MKELLRTAQGRLLASVVALVALLNAPRQVIGDTWFNLVLGREIVERGLVTRNELTAEAWGAPWIDLQWLAHLLHYAIVQLVGLPGLVWIASLLTCSALLAGSGFALAQGATPGRTLLAGVLALAGLMPQSVRAQTFALPLLVIFLCLLAADAERAARRTWWLVPCAALWGNLHGSALLAPLLGALLAVARVLDAARARRRPDLGLLVRDLLLAAACGGALLASPYGVRVLEYYRAILDNSAFRAHLGEWGPLAIGEEPVKGVLIASVFLLVALGFRAVRSFPPLVCVALAFATLRSARHATPLAFAAAAFLPALADSACRELLRFHADRRLQGVTRLLLPAAALGFCIGSPLLAAHTLRVDEPPSFTDRVALAAQHAQRILADEHHADRLLWFHPELRGRLSHDVRIEILPLPFITSVTQAYGLPETAQAREWLARYDLIVVDRDEHTPLWNSLRRNPAWTEVASDRFAAAFARGDTLLGLTAREQPGRRLLLHEQGLPVRCCGGSSSSFDPPRKLRAQ